MQLETDCDLTGTYPSSCFLVSSDQTETYIATAAHPPEPLAQKIFKDTARTAHFSSCEGDLAEYSVFQVYVMVNKPIFHQVHKFEQVCLHREHLRQRGISNCLSHFRFDYVNFPAFTFLGLVSSGFTHVSLADSV